MRRNLWNAGRAVALSTAVLVVVVALLPGRLAPAVRIYALVLCAVAIALALAMLRRGLPPARDLLPRTRRPAPHTIARLDRLENEVALGMAGSFDLHYRLRPRVRALAAGLLASRRGISLDAEPSAARAVLGHDAWDLVRGDRPPPENRLARGLTQAELAAVVESLERI